MKKFLSVLLAVMMVLSTFVMAAPSAVVGFDTAKENEDTAGEAADLAADTTFTTSTNTNLISTLGGQITVTASAGTVSVDTGATGATATTSGASATITAPNTTADGIVKVTASDGSVKNIYIKTDANKKISSTIPINSTNFHAGNEATVTISGGTANLQSIQGYLGIHTKDYGMSIATYPYIWFTARTATPKTYGFKVYLTQNGTSHSESLTISTSVPLTTEYSTFALDMSTLGLTGQFGGMMFCLSNEGNIEFSEVKLANYDPAGTTYGFALTADKYSIDEENDADTAIILTPEFFSDKSIASKDVTYTYDESKVIVSKDQATGVATLTPLKSGECVITATPAIDPSLSASVTLQFNNVAAKASTRDIHYLAIGNSYLEYNPSTTGYVGWWMTNNYVDENGNDLRDANENTLVALYENRGMAASTVEKDYYHRIGAGLADKFKGSFTTGKFNCATAERAWEVGGNSADTFDYVTAEASVRNAYAGLVTYLQEQKPNVITVQVQENTGLGNTDTGSVVAEWYYDLLYSIIDENRPEKSVVVIIPPIDGKNGMIANAQKAVIKNKGYNFYIAEEIGDFAPYDGDKQNLPITSNGIGVPDYKYENPHLAYLQYKEFDEQKLLNPGWADFRGHPSDYGFKRMAEEVLPIMYAQIPQVIDAETIIIPVDLGEIKHDKAINSNGNPVIKSKPNANLDLNNKDSLPGAAGVATLYLDEITPVGAPTAVKWTIDNENVATIVSGKGDGAFLVAKRNGLVTVTATSSYDSTLSTSLIFEITGQDPHYKLQYNPGTNDTVSNMPNYDLYASGNYVFPAANPIRNGFKFAGWSTTLGGEVVDSVYMSADTTVYATWEFATDWQFNKDGFFEGAEVGGMHAKVENGVATGNAFATAAGMSVSNLLIPSDSFTTFKSRIGFSDVADGDKLVLTIKNSAGNSFEFKTPISATGLAEYSFDISNVEGTITSFSLFSSNGAHPTNVVTCDYMTFVKDVVIGDQTFDSYTVEAIDSFEVGNNKVTFTNLTVNAGATLELGAGNYVIGNLTNNGTIIASPNANVIVTGANKPAGYVEIDIDTKQNTVRYAEVDGKEYAISEAAQNDKYGMIITGDADKILQIEDGSKTKYYFIDASAKTYREVTGLADVLKSTENAVEFGTNDDGKYGAKFENTITVASKDESAAFNITEYGYIVTIDELMGAEQLNFDADASKYAYGAAYEKGVSDKVVEEGADVHNIRAVIYGASTGTMYGKKLVVKTYTKVIVKGKEFIVYGPAQYESFYSLADKLENSDIATEIINATKNDSNEPELDYDDLWN